MVRFHATSKATQKIMKTEKPYQRQIIPFFFLFTAQKMETITSASIAYQFLVWG